jgi:hypothetical protein
MRAGKSGIIACTCTPHQPLKQRNSAEGLDPDAFSAGVAEVGPPTARRVSR